MKTSLSILVLSLLPSLAMADMAHHHHEDNSHAVSTSGKPGDLSNVARTIEITMDDNMRFTPSSIKANKGETIKLLISNLGKIEHELVIGEMSELLNHAKMMRDMPDMVHEEPNMLNLAPGQHGEIIWNFDHTGTVDFACLIPGHMESGMKGAVEVL